MNPRPTIRPSAPLAALLAALLCGPAPAVEGYPRRSPTPAEVAVRDEFWGPRLERNREVTIPHLIRLCDRTGLVDNFAVAAGREAGTFSGMRNGDEVVYKTVEAASYAIAARPDPALEAEVGRIVEAIAAAQEEDGYLVTHRTIALAGGRDPAAPARWSNPRDDELYLNGHLYEAAVAHFEATGDRALLDAATRNADLVDRTFGVGKRRQVCGHPEIEPALVRLFGATGERRHLGLAEFFVAERGRHVGRESLGPFAQDHAPIEEQAEAVGQAPRATYFYSGVADVAALTGNRSYVEALERLWDDVVGSKLYVTGGIGARHDNEGFGGPFELPNRTAYAEACAAVSFSMWNDRMSRLLGDAKYVNVLERTLYNNFLACTSIAGDAFFYACPLESDGEYRFNRGWVPRGHDGPFAEAEATRKPWFACACCPPNLARYLERVPGLAYAADDEGLYVNLFISGEARLEAGGLRVTLAQRTRYPWDGRVRIAVEPDRPAEFALRVRIPGWAREEPVPSGLYRFGDEPAGPAVLAVNGVPIAPGSDRGYAVIRRRWEPGDEVVLDLPMPVRRVRCHPSVAENRGRVALQRGPIVYCVEGVDHGGRVLDLQLPEDARLRAESEPHLLGGVVVIRGEARSATDGARRPLTAIPYHSWSNRGAGEMAVWLPGE